MTEDGPADGTPRDRRTRGPSPFEDNEARGRRTARTTSQEALAERKLFEQRFQHEERAKDNAQRRLFLNVGGTLLVGLLVASFLVAAFGPSSDARSRAWDLINLLVTGVVAAVAGYLSAKTGR